MELVKLELRDVVRGERVVDGPIPETKTVWQYDSELWQWEAIEAG